MFFILALDLFVFKGGTYSARQKTVAGQYYQLQNINRVSQLGDR